MIRNTQKQYTKTEIITFVLDLAPLEWDTFNPDCLIRISNVDTFYFLLNTLFFG